MRIGIQISSSLRQQTGVEKYIYQLISHLAMLKKSKKHRFFLYLPKREDIKLSENFQIKILKWPFKKLWTQIRLSLEMLKNKPDVLFVPAHTFPIIHPRLVVVIQGLEYEAMPETYSFLKRRVLRFLTKRNAKKAEKIIVPSECTKRDLIKFYNINPSKIFVIHHGVEKTQNAKCKMQNNNSKLKKYILYLGTCHKRKNIEGLKMAFKTLKEKYKIEHELILAGASDYVSEKKKRQLLKNADIFVYPSFYEGFGLPALEAQVACVPVVASNTSSFPEILGDSALLVNPQKPEEIGEAIYKIIKNPFLKQSLIKKGQENVKRFSWLKCAEETLKVIIL